MLLIAGVGILSRVHIWVQVRLMHDREIEAIEFYPGYFGVEEQWSGWSNPKACAPADLATCIANTKSMRQAAYEAITMNKHHEVAIDKSISARKDRRVQNCQRFWDRRAQSIVPKSDMERPAASAPLHHLLSVPQSAYRELDRSRPNLPKP